MTAETALPERLLETATHLFAENGYENTSVQEIVTAAGVTKGAMYHYFAAKDDLLYEIYHRLLALRTERLERLAGGAGTAEERLHAVVIDMIDTSCAHLDGLTVFFRSMHLLPEDKRRAVRAERRRYHERFRALVEEGQRDGTFRPDVPADLAVDFLFGAVHQISTWWHPDGALGAHDVGAYYLRLFLDGLRRTDDGAPRLRAVSERRHCQTGGMQRKMSLDALAREHADRAGSQTTGRSSTTVYGGHERVLRQTLIALAAGRSMSEHENPGEATMVILRGRVRLLADGDVWDGRSGDLLVIPDTRHSVEAVEDSVLLLTVAKLGP